MKRNNLKRQFDISLIALVVVILVCFVTGCMQNAEDLLQPEPPVEPAVLTEEVLLSDRLFELELALDDDQRASGLMGRLSMADDQGMLFVFPDSPPFPTELSFWMKSCLIPIDVIFISRDGQIVSIHEMEPPLPDTADQDLVLYPSGGPVQFAIEIRGGLAAELGLQPGDQIDLRSGYLLELAE